MTDLVSIKHNDIDIVSFQDNGQIKLNTTNTYIIDNITAAINTVPEYQGDLVTLPNKPTNLTPSATYTGNEITNGYTKPEHVTMIGQDRGVQIGTYTATYILEDGYYWSDLTQNTLTVTLIITQAEATFRYETSLVSYLPGMTWQTFVNSTYNTLNFTINQDDTISSQYGSDIANITYGQTMTTVTKNDIIQNNNFYYDNFYNGGDVYIDDELIEYLANMTWEQWVNSCFNNNIQAVYSNNNITKNNKILKDDWGEVVQASDQITDEHGENFYFV